MLCIKKIWRDDLFHLALLLSLLRVDRPGSDWTHYGGSIVGVGRDSWAAAPAWSSPLRNDYISPKSVDSMLSNYERWVIHDLNLLGRYSDVFNHEVTAYVGLSGGDQPSTSGYFNDDERFSLSELGSPRDWGEEENSDADLTVEEMELIEVLWKQDVDMGFSLEEFQGNPEGECSTAAAVVGETKPEEKELEAVKGQLAKPNSNGPVAIKEELDSDEPDPWAGLSYTVDLETGEYILKEACESLLSELSEAEQPPSFLLDLSLEEALQLVGLDDDHLEGDSSEDSGAEGGVSGSDPQSPDSPEPSEGGEVNLEEQLKILQEMLQVPPSYTRSIQGGGGQQHGGQYGGGVMPSQQARMPGSSGGYSRSSSSSSDQRWQDLASIIHDQPNPYHHHHQTASSTHPHHHHHQQGYPHLQGPTSAITPGGMKHMNPQPFPIGCGAGGSMNLMTNSSEPMGSEPVATTFKVENPHDMMYYQNCSDPNPNPEGFISSFLNDEELFMDMSGMNEGMYSMKMIENSGTTGTGAADSDSAVSSMGSERVPSLTSDTDWMETNSDSGHTPADHFMATSDFQTKYRWYDYNYCRQHSTESAANSGSGRLPVAQKKYQLYGKRLFQDQMNGNNGNNPSVPENNNLLPGGIGGAGENGGTPLVSKFEYSNVVAPLPPPPAYTPSSPIDMVKPPHTPYEIKYSASLEFMRHTLGAMRSTPTESAIHNHTYHMPPEDSGVLQRPFTRDKRDCEDLEDDFSGGKRGSSEESSLSRDERRARSLAIPIPVEEIINLPMDEFNERLSKYDLSETQLSLIRDIRRRGKNKVAAQNCRKRKLDQILYLADEVKLVREKKQRLLMERDSLVQERHRIKAKVSQLYRHIFQAMRDKDGNPYSVYEWSLQQNLDGTIMLVPRNNGLPNPLDLQPQQRQSSNSSSSSSSDSPPSTSKKQIQEHQQQPHRKQ